MTTARMPPSLWAGQLAHFACLIFLLILTWTAWLYLDKPFPIYFWSGVAFPIVHQVFVWLTWRIELRSSKVSKMIGLQGYVVLFFLLFSGRFVSLIALAWVDRGSLGLQFLTQMLVTTLLTLIGLYAMYSVKRYFGMVRASGADHFDPKYRDMPFVKEGIFRYTNNGMYIYAFLLFWAVAIGCNSSAAFIVAAFSHAYIWVHFYTTEKTDMNYIYAST